MWRRRSGLWSFFSFSSSSSFPSLFHLHSFFQTTQYFPEYKAHNSCLISSCWYELNLINSSSHNLMAFYSPSHLPCFSFFSSFPFINPRRYTGSLISVLFFFFPFVTVNFLEIIVALRITKTVQCSYTCFVFRWTSSLTVYTLALPEHLSWAQYIYQKNRN